MTGKFTKPSLGKPREDGRRMLTNVRGLVERLDLPISKGMMPLFEAISNALDAIEEKKIPVRAGQIRVRLLRVGDLVQQAGDSTFLVDGFEVSDNGAGFTERNLSSFEEAYTRTKAVAGGKGVGRFTYLKVFREVHIRSVFEASNHRYERNFTFSIAGEVQGAENRSSTNAPTGSVVTVRGMSESYRPSWPQDIVLIAERIIAHFLIRFAARACLPITLEAAGFPSIDLQTQFQATVAAHIEERFFNSGEHTFALQAFRHLDGRSRHEYHLCAHGRSAISCKLRDLLPEIPEKLVNARQQPYTLIVLVTGEYLDQYSNNERTAIKFASETDPDIDPFLLSRAEFTRSLAETLREVLEPDLRVTNDEKVSQIEDFVQRAPEYRVLTHEKYRRLIEQRVQPGLNDDQLDHALLRLRRELEDNVRREERSVAALIETESFEQYQDRIRSLIEEMNDVGKAKLADYVAHRRTILDLMRQSLKRVKQDDAYPFEKVLHKMIFPMGITSKDIFLDQQNLWVIDERLCFHTLLTSDKKLNQIEGLENTSGKEPDIFAFFYDTPIAIAEPDNLPGGGVVIIEFKRPGRDDYTKDPADQIVQRFVEISGGDVKDIEGRLINPDRLRYLGYLIADLTPSLRKQVAMRYHKSADNEGYFYTLPDGNGYIEIISYDKLLKDASRRNRVLFEKLGIQKPPS